MRSRDELISSARIHGGVSACELARLGISSDQVVDFSVNTNPFGPCPAVVTAAKLAILTQYPDSSAHAVRVKIAEKHDLDPAQVVVGNGAADLLWTLARALVKESVRVLIAEPTFSEFRAAALASGAEIIEWRAQASQFFSIDLNSMDKRLRESGARVVYLASPNTPTGNALSVADIAEFALAHPAASIILDQSFIMLSDHHFESWQKTPDNVIRVRSLTKDHGIPGLRIGYILASAALTRRVENLRPSWTTNSVAQAAALAALSEDTFVEQSWFKLKEDCAGLVQSLTDLNLKPFPTSTFFFVVNVGSAEKLRHRLLQHRIVVRDCASFGLPDFIRVCARPKPDCERLISALKKELFEC